MVVTQISSNKKKYKLASLSPNVNAMAVTPTVKCFLSTVLVPADFWRVSCPV